MTRLKKCPHCDSTLTYRKGRPHCTGNNLYTMRSIFDEVISLEVTDPIGFADKVKNIQSTEGTFDLFLDYWKSDSRHLGITCPHDERYKQSLDGEGTMSLAMPDPYIPFPDLVEVYLAETMLDRPLTVLEKEGSHKIPKINEEGQVYYAPLTWLIYPHSYMTTYKDMVVKDTFDDPPAEVYFDFESLKGRCKR